MLFTSRTFYTIKINNKPINKSYKIWVFYDCSYIYIWFYYLGQDGIEAIPKAGIKVEAIAFTILSINTPIIIIQLALTFIFII